MERMQERFSADFHPDPTKGEGTDVVEKLVEKLQSVEDALDEIKKNLERDPHNAEAQRQANLIINRGEDLSRFLKEKTQH